MDFIKKIDKILAAFGNVRAMERNHTDTYTENLILNIPGEKIAESPYGQLFVEFQELNGYHFLNAVILSGTNIKTLKGAKLVFSSQNEGFTLNSDTLEIETEFSNVSNRFMTPVSFVLKPHEIKKVKAKEYDKVEFLCKKKIIPFSTIKTS